MRFSASKKTTKLSYQILFLIFMVIAVLILAALISPLWAGPIEGYTSYASLDGSSVGVSYGSPLGESPNCTHTVGGLHCDGGDGATVGQLDRFYGLPSDIHCASSGLTKSGGNVCLDKVTNQLMTSRGGNA